ncbi:hypothetical protein NKR19_g2198, partial [Coniochaeta hoffmannii]
PTARPLCWAFTSSHFGAPTSSSSPLQVHECPNQGYCSYTLFLPDTQQIIQFRPRPHQLNTTLSRLAREVYGVMAPETRSLGVLPIPSPDHDRDPAAVLLLFVYAMTLVPGISLTDFRRRSASPLSGEVRVQRAILVKDFARFLATGWKARRPREAIPFSSGRLGGSLRARAEMMREGLPIRFRGAVAEVLGAMERVEALPWVLTHGDVVADNIMVEPDGGTERGTGWWPGTMRGMLDWAESEYLPFGVGMYGLEEMLGQSVRVWDGEGRGWRERFAYYPEAGDLRRLFWQELERAVPVLAGDREVRDAVEKARVLGVLLWRGFAFDDGRINRVVQEGRDQAEVQRLDMFLFGTDDPEMMGHAQVAPGHGEMEGQGGIKKPLVTVTVAESEKQSEVPKRWNLTRRISSMLM